MSMDPNYLNNIFLNVILFLNLFLIIVRNTFLKYFKYREQLNQSRLIDYFNTRKTKLNMEVNIPY